MNIAQLLELLITKKYYTEGVITSKVNFFYAMSQITDEEYSNSMLLISTTYTEEDTTIDENTTLETPEESEVF